MMEACASTCRHSIDVTVLPGFVRTKPSKPGKRPKPFQLELEAAAERLARAIERRKPYYAFPGVLWR
jgi:hypothetical protein